MIKLTREQTEAVVQHPDGVECQGDGTNKTYILMDVEVAQRMRKSVYHTDVCEAVAEGMADVRAGRVMSVNDAQERVRSECGFPGANA